MPSVASWALRLVSSSLTTLHDLADDVFNVVAAAWSSLPSLRIPATVVVKDPDHEALGATRRHGGSAIALERDAVVRRPAADGIPPANTPSSPAHRLRFSASPPLPSSPERDRLVALPRAPGSLFAYWRVSSERRSQLRSELGPLDDPAIREALRIRLLEDGELESERAEWTVPLPPRATSRHLENLPAGRTLELEIGFEGPGRFTPLCPAIVVRTPEPLPPSPHLAGSGRKDEREPSFSESAVRGRPWTGYEGLAPLTPPSSDEWSAPRDESRVSTVPGRDRS